MPCKGRGAKGSSKPAVVRTRRQHIRRYQLKLSEAHIMNATYLLSMASNVKNEYEQSGEEGSLDEAV